MGFPKDSEYEEVTIQEAKKSGEGWTILRSDGWSLFMPGGDYPDPKDGDSLRVYGRSIGFPFRGLFLNGHKVFYRTAAEDSRHQDESSYGKDADDLLARWDARKSVFTVEMGGFGPGYEQALQIAMFEVLRSLLRMGPLPERLKDDDYWKTFRAIIDDVVMRHPPVSELGLSGAQAGAAISLAVRLYVHGPIEVIKSVVSDRRIQVSNNIRFEFATP